jgi:precorrin-2 methylase
MAKYVVSQDGTVLLYDECVVVELTLEQGIALCDHPFERDRYRIAQWYRKAQDTEYDYNAQDLRDEISRCKMIQLALEGEPADFPTYDALQTRVDTLEWILDQMEVSREPS